MSGAAPPIPGDTVQRAVLALGSNLGDRLTTLQGGVGALLGAPGLTLVALSPVYETRPVEGETWPLVGDQIDVGPLLHDTALLALPLAPLCDDDCQGPAPDQFPAVAPGADEEPEADPEPDGAVPRDPRWAALDDLDL